MLVNVIYVLFFLLCCLSRVDYGKMEEFDGLIYGNASVFPKVYGLVLIVYGNLPWLKFWFDSFHNLEMAMVNQADMLV